MASGTSEATALAAGTSAIENPERLAALHTTGLLDSEAEEVFDRLTRLAVRLLKVPASFISLVDTNRDFYKSACGFGEPLASTRELAGLTFCHYTIQQTTPLVIPDTAADPVYSQVPTVRTLGVAAYVGVPITVANQIVGAFCTIDVRPRDWTADEVEVLVELAASAQREMELRISVADERTLVAEARLQQQRLERLNSTLQEQAVELEMQAEELHVTAAHLEERTEAAEDANKAKSGFLSMMSHELRTPLNAINGYAELMELGVSGRVTTQQEEFLGRIKRAGKHLQTLIGDILEFTHLDAGHVKFEIEDTNIESVITEAAEMLSPQMTDCGIELVRARAAADPSESCMAEADPKLVRQVLINLLTNAIKFTPQSGRVTVAVDCSARVVRVQVTDTGRGIPDDSLERIFEPFVQLDRSEIPTNARGVGLGLAICRHLARGMHGDLVATSRVGKGSTFTLSLPAARA